MRHLAPFPLTGRHQVGTPKSSCLCAQQPAFTKAVAGCSVAFKPGSLLGSSSEAVPSRQKRSGNRLQELRIPAALPSLCSTQSPPGSSPGPAAQCRFTEKCCTEDLALSPLLGWGWDHLPSLTAEHQTQSQSNAQPPEHIRHGARAPLWDSRDFHHLPKHQHEVPDVGQQGLTLTEWG